MEARTRTASRLRDWWQGALRTGAVAAGVLAFGLGWAALAGRAAGGPYTAAPVSEERWLVDGFNVLHAGVLRGSDRRGWWREESRARLLERVAGFDAEVWVVFDGPGPGAEAERASRRPRVVFAPSADEWLLAAVRNTPDPATVVVVTADRQLADRARHRGARVVSPRAFLSLCAEEEAGPRI